MEPPWWTAGILQSWWKTQSTVPKVFQRTQSCCRGSLPLPTSPGVPACRDHTNTNLSPWKTCPELFGHSWTQPNKTNWYEQNKLVHVPGRTKLGLTRCCQATQATSSLWEQHMTLRGKSSCGLIAETLSRCLCSSGSFRILWGVKQDENTL